MTEVASSFITQEMTTPLNTLTPHTQGGIETSQSISRMAADLMCGKIQPDSFLKPENRIIPPNEHATANKLVPEQLQNDYLNMLEELSPCADTLDLQDAALSSWERVSPEIVAQKREAFNDIKADLKSQWEDANGMEWPKYQEDVYSDNGNIIRKAGNDYDAHHIRPLCLGGENEASNITPLHARDHYDKQGIHATDTPYNKLTKVLNPSL